MTTVRWSGFGKTKAITEILIETEIITETVGFAEDPNHISTDC